MTDYNSGATYRMANIDTLRETVPNSPVFRSRPGETHVFEERAENISSYRLTKALETNQINTLDKTVISLVAIFSAGACTTRNIMELLTMMGKKPEKQKVESSLRRLHKYQLINFSRFHTEEYGLSNLKVITLTSYGSRLARSLGVAHKFNILTAATAEPYAIKSRCEMAQLLCNWLKNLPVESFELRPVKMVDVSSGAIIRPAATMDIWDETIYFEVPRRHEGWLCNLINKLHRYELVFGKDAMPTVIINGEDEAMNAEIFKAVEKENINTDIMYTDDLSTFGKGFKTSLYGFDANMQKLCYCIEVGQTA